MSSSTDIRLSNTALTAWEKAVADHQEGAPRRSEDADTGDVWVFDGRAAYRVHMDDEIGLNRVRVLPEAMHETSIVPLLARHRATTEAMVTFLRREGGDWILVVPLEAGVPAVWLNTKHTRVLASRGLIGWTVRLQPPTLSPLADGEAPHMAPALFWGPGDDPTDDPRMMVIPVHQNWDEHKGTEAIARVWLDHYRPKGGKDGDVDDDRDGISSVEMSFRGRSTGKMSGRTFEQAMDRIARGDGP